MGHQWERNQYSVPKANWTPECFFFPVNFKPQFPLDSSVVNQNNHSERINLVWGYFIVASKRNWYVLALVTHYILTFLLRRRLLVGGRRGECKYFIVLRFYLFLEGKRGREISIHGCLLHTSYWGPGLQPRLCALTGNGTSNPLVCRPAFNPLSHTNQGPLSTCLW